MSNDQDFMKSFSVFVADRQNVSILGNEAVKQEYQALLKELNKVDDIMIERLGRTKEALALAKELSAAYGRVYGLQIDNAYLQGIKDAYAFMKMLKGGTCSE